MLPQVGLGLSILGIRTSCVFGLIDKKHRGTIDFLSAAAIFYIFYKTKNPNQANGVRSRGKRQLRFEIAGVKSQC
jgi:hypothetical protein